MSRILVMTSPARGLLYPVVETLVTLRRRGAAVHVITLADEVVRMQDLGFTASALPPELNDAHPGDWKGDGRRSVGALTDGLIDRAEAEFRHLTSTVSTYRPDMILTDVSATGAQCAAEASGLPWAIWCPTFLPLFSTDGPPIGLGLRPGTTRAARMRDVGLAHVSRAIWEFAFKKKFNRWRLTHDLPAVAHCDEPLRRAPLIMSFCGPPLENRHGDWPDTVELVGPSSWAPPTEPDPVIDAITDPIALVTCSTELQADSALAGTALAALEDSGLHAVVTTGALDPDTFTSTANSTVTRFVPHEQVLATASVVITHGGMGITQKALARGIPLVIVPFGRDQRDVAVRVHAGGSGVRLDPRDLTPETLRAAVSTALGRTEDARRVASIVSAEGSAVRAADHIERILAARRTTGAVA
ncbi:glycosyltransferase [Williamsia maris]|uniref:Glycosyltransferase, MGT family n=2 Tax=Williamsia maris TaxID=72806 RepID=A0ABT1HFH8_9NOCA|nr:glycosyltransferase, MGT family [Williamsia maris]